MTTIPNLNIVIQQGNSVRDVHNIKNNVLDASQIADNERVEEEDKKRNSIHEPDETEHILLNKEKERGDRKKEFKKKKNTKKDADTKDDDPDSTGRLLDVIG